jgi:hypothetical protein
MSRQRMFLSTKRAAVSTYLLLSLCLAHIFQRAASAQNGQGRLEVLRVFKYDVSPPLRTIPPLPPQAGPKREIPLRGIFPDAITPAQTDPVVQTSTGPLVSGSVGMNVPGVGAGFVGPSGSFSVDAAPPDPNGSVGDTQYVQWVNTSFAIFDKSSGAPVYGPAAGNTLWGGDFPCGWTNDGDPTVVFDKAAHRWVFSQLSYSLGYYFSCVAISQTSDATGAFYRYVWQFSNLNDYPKLAVWPDGYYMSFNMFKPSFFSYSFVGAQVCALERAKMLSGDPNPVALCFQLGSSYNSLLASDLDGTMAPPAGSPNYFLNLGKNSLRLWKFHADFANYNNSTLAGPITIGVANFSKACGGGTCIPQPGTAQQLDSLGDRLMYRLAYRNFGDHESLVANHSVNVGSGGHGGGASKVGIRWYELRNPGGTPVVYQQGTFSPDSAYRWMGSIAMDKVGNIALGYSVSSNSVFPGIRYTGRSPADPLNTLQTEGTLFNGLGSQQSGLSRWGDYSSISVDPVDDCTFWYTNEYLPTSGTFNWSTRIASFQLSSCQ